MFMVEDKLAAISDSVYHWDNPSNSVPSFRNPNGELKYKEKYNFQDSGYRIWALNVASQRFRKHFFLYEYQKH